MSLAKFRKVFKGPKSPPPNPPQPDTVEDNKNK